MVQKPSLPSSLQLLTNATPPGRTSPALRDRGQGAARQRRGGGDLAVGTLESGKPSWMTGLACSPSPP